MDCETKSRDSCHSSCCGQDKETRSGDLCVPRTPDQGHTETRRSVWKPQEEGANRPDCCKDKPSPCCDVSCLDRIALRECEKGPTPSPKDLSLRMFKSISDYESDQLH
jgi:Cu2+-exporting ATPase